VGALGLAGFAIWWLLVFSGAGFLLSVFLLFAVLPLTVATLFVLSWRIVRPVRERREFATANESLDTAKAQPHLDVDGRRSAHIFRHSCGAARGPSKPTNVTSGSRSATIAPICVRDT
jgi:hypothetical protein